MKKLLAFIMFQFWGLIFAQDLHYKKVDNSCESGINEAEKDFENGNLKYLSYGLIGYNDRAYSDFHNQFVFKNYNVILGEGGCIVSDKSECYRETMGKLIRNKYGNDFFERVYSESEKAYPQSDYFKEKILPEIENGDFVMIQNSLNDSVMTQFIHENIDLSQLEKMSTVNLSYVLEKTGKLSNIEITNTNNQILADLIVKTLDKYPQQVPFNYYGYDVNAKRRVTLKFPSTIQ